MKANKDVEGLIEALKDEYSDVQGSAAEALEKIAWQPKDDIEKAYYLIVKNQWDKLVKLGEPALGPLIEALKNEDMLWGHGFPAKQVNEVPLLISFID
jgi:HEAT repeat protein